MRITAEMAIHGVARTLRDRIAPALEDPYACEALRLATLLLAITADGLDDAVPIRVAEIAGLRAVFAEAGALDLADRGLAGRLDAASRAAVPEPRPSVLEAEIGALRRLLIALHEAVEARDDAPARALDRAIWRHLAEVDAARAPRG